MKSRQAGRHIPRTFAVLSATAIALAAAPPPAAARTSARTISGSLSQGGYTVIALGYNGRTAMSKSRNFQITAPDSRMTLQLRDRRGKYAGPVIVAGGESSVIEGIKAGAQLPPIRILSGYARTARPLAGRFVDRTRWAQAKGGVPIGNGRNFGLVRSLIHNGPGGPGGDTSRTGVPNLLSIDTNGDGVIDALAPARTVNGPLAHVAQAVQPLQFFSTLYLFPDSTVNADAASVTNAQIDAGLKKQLHVLAANVPAGNEVSLDCGGLSYCSKGGTGKLWDKNGDSYYPFPSCCDAGHTGFGNLRGTDALGLGAFGLGGPNSWGLLFPAATSSQIGSGDTYVLRVTKGGTVTNIPATLPYVFTTVPAISSYEDGAGHAVTISYPYHCTEPGLGEACGFGSERDPLPVAANASGHVVMTLHVWRPQRRGIAGAGEPTWMDVGHLNYSIEALPLGSFNGAPRNHSQSCSAASLSATDPSLAVIETGANPGGDFGGIGNNSGAVRDASPDQPSGAGNLLTFSVDLTQCMKDMGGTGFDSPNGSIGLLAWTGDGTGYAYQGNIWIQRSDRPAPPPKH